MVRREMLVGWSRDAFNSGLEGAVLECMGRERWGMANLQVPIRDAGLREEEITRAAVRDSDLDDIVKFVGGWMLDNVLPLDAW